MPMSKEETQKKLRKTDSRKGKPRKITPAILKNKGGRPSEFEEASPKIILSIRNGNTYECASGCAGITYQTFNEWIKKGNEDLKNNIESKFSKFSYDVLKAEKECEEEVLGYWKKEMPENWQACRDFLSRRHHKDWGSKDKVDVNASVKVSKIVTSEIDDNGNRFVKMVSHGND